MLAHNIHVNSFTELRTLVYETLCNDEQIEPGAFPMTQRILTRGNSPCGIYFCLHGPRSVKCTSIWETDQNTILFYGNGGVRFQKTHLASAPELESEANLA